MSALALIVAAGVGRRAGDGPPKQYRALNGRSVLARSIDAFSAHPRIERVAVVIHPDHAALWSAVADSLAGPTPDIVTGGAERQESVRCGLEHLASEPPDVVLIHDAARPLVSAAVIDRVLDALQTADGALAALPVVDTLRREASGVCGAPVDRDGLWRAQTPQGFRFGKILAAHRAAKGRALTDDAEVARRAGLDVLLALGEEDNFKLTTPADFAAAEARLAVQEGGAARAADIRIGQGYDVHKFGPNADGSSDHVMLCGLAVPHDTGLVGHSDADVGLHALTDALLGAIAEGDIGAHFPPSDPTWGGAASDQFLAHAAALVSARGGRITALDVTLVCERPKIRPHVAQMRARIAAIAGVEITRVSVKATTSEGLGFTGRREGIAALATATVAL